MQKNQKVWHMYRKEINRNHPCGNPDVELIDNYLNHRLQICLKNKRNLGLKN